MNYAREINVFEIIKVEIFICHENLIKTDDFLMIKLVLLYLCTSYLYIGYSIILQLLKYC